MGCDDCDNAPLHGAYLRLGAADIEIVACRKHWLEARDLLLAKPTPDLTEALARLKALEDSVVMAHPNEPWLRDEIAAIRTKLEGK